MRHRPAYALQVVGLDMPQSSGDDSNLSTDRSGAVAETWNRIGQQLGEVVAAMLQLAADLRPMLDNDDAAALDKLVRDAQRDACRIAVIGQVKAGKSRLVNALIRRPGFLPTDVNPWTAAVTNMHFGEQAAGAVYQFFDEADWQHLATGGRLSELSRRLGIALDADTLASQVRSMRERAERRLGQQFRQLLGKQHRFASTSAEVLQRYVCLGDPDRDPAGREPPLGRFADITKSADLYFDLAPFAYPTTIVDTPGMNDPFLVRDELSREALTGADAYIVVLNAQQALSSSDLDLLRLLHGLQKTRLVVFVNRVDLLANPATDGAIVVAHIRRRLADEFPGVAVPIIPGSAMWAEAAVASDKAATAMPDRTAAIQALTDRDGSQQTALSDDATWRTELMQSSGLVNLIEIVSRLIVQGPAMLRVSRSLDVLRDMAWKIDIGAHSELLSLELRMSASHEEPDAMARQQAAAAEEPERLNAISEAVTGRVEAAISELRSEKESATRRLADALRDVIRRHAALAREMLLVQQQFTRRDHVWQYQTSPLRRDLEQEFQKIYKSSADQLGEIERTANAAILSEIKDLVPANGPAAEAAPVHVIDAEPSISALGQRVAFELDDQWRSWWRLWHGRKQRARRLEELLVAEFQPVADALVDAAEAELDTHVVISAQRFSQLGRDLIEIVKRRRLDLEADRDGKAKTKESAKVREDQERQKQLEERVQRCVKIADALKLLSQRCVSPGSTTRPSAPE
jgi:signal recognition particle receptor subunit beta